MKTALKIVSLCLFLIFSVDSHSQDLITNTLNRKTFSLNGTRNYIVDDEMGNHLGIVAFNQYTGWYGGSLEDAP